MFSSNEYNSKQDSLQEGLLKNVIAGGIARAGNQKKSFLNKQNSTWIF